MTTDEHRGVKGHGVHCAATSTRKTCACAAPEPRVLAIFRVAVRSEQAIVPFLHLRSSYALEDSSEYGGDK